MLTHTNIYCFLSFLHTHLHPSLPNSPDTTHSSPCSLNIILGIHVFHPAPPSNKPQHSGTRHFSRPLSHISRYLFPSIKSKQVPFSSCLLLCTLPEALPSLICSCSCSLTCALVCVLCVDDEMRVCLVRAEMMRGEGQKDGMGKNMCDGECDGEVQPCEG